MFTTLFMSVARTWSDEHLELSRFCSLSVATHDRKHIYHPRCLSSRYIYDKWFVGDSWYILIHTTCPTCHFHFSTLSMVKALSPLSRNKHLESLQNTRLLVVSMVVISHELEPMQGFSMPLWQFFESPLQSTHQTKP